MAEKRMFAKTIVLSDAFLDMPLSARCLYFTLGMVADDDGFVNAPKSIMRQCGASIDDMKILLAKKFLLDFETGVIVIKHWRINNYLRSDRYQQTKYTEERECLELEENGSYVKIGNPSTQPVGLISTAQTVTKRKRIPLIERDPVNDIEKVEKLYLLNYKKLYEQGIVKTEKPIINWNVSRNLTKSVIENYGLDVILQAVEKSLQSEFCVSKGYCLTTILSAGVLCGLINGNSTGKNPAIDNMGVDSVSQDKLENVRF